MAKSLSLDLRSRALSAVSAGASHREAAARFGVSAASVSRWRSLARVQGDASPKSQGGDRRSGRVEAQASPNLELREAAPDATIAELRAALAERGHGFGYGTIRRFFLRHRTTRKKDRTCRRAGSPRRPEAPGGLVRGPTRSRPRTADLHRRNLGQDQHDAQPRPPTPGPAAAHGAPHGHWRTSAFIAGFGLRGWVAPLVFSGPINREVFEAWVEQAIVPELRRGDVVILDNPSSHKGARAREMRAGRRRADALPPALQPRFQPHRERLRPSSKPSCKKPPSAPSTVCGAPSAKASTHSDQPRCTNYFAACGCDQE